MLEVAFGSLSPASRCLVDRIPDAHWVKVSRSPTSAIRYRPLDPGFTLKIQNLSRILSARIDLLRVSRQVNTTGSPHTYQYHKATLAMGSKRPFSDVDGSIPQKDAVNKKRKQQFKSHYRSNDSGPPKLGQSLNEVKKRARNIERRFAKGDNLPADVQQRLERELVQCKRQISDLQHKKKRQEMISKYHKVRFFGTSSSHVM